MVYNTQNPLAPSYIGGKKFVCYSCPAKPPGDYDWVQFNISICDDCRYGVSHFWQAGAALFDLGTGTDPQIQSGARYYEASSDTIGAFTFSHNGQQYLIMNNLIKSNPEDFPSTNYDCDAQFKPTLFMFNGTDPSGLTDIGCVEPVGASLSVANGIYIKSGAYGYIYLIDRATYKVHIFKLGGSGASLSLQYMGSPMFGYAKFGTGIRVDVAAELLVTAVQGTPSGQLWDISDPGQPAMIANFDQYLGGVKVARAAIRYPLVWLGKNAGKETFTFDISDLADPKPLDQEFWDFDNPWNSDALTNFPYLANTDADFNGDGSVLFLARYSVFQVINSGACGPDLPPTANFTLAPDSIFPGDQITVTNTSAGIIEAFAIWITNSAGEIVKGSNTLSATTSSKLSYTIPIDLALDEAYTVHLAVENSANPFIADAPGDQLKEQVLTINRAPKAVITTIPATAITGAQVTISAADTEGNPSDPSGANPYQWIITPPNAQSYSAEGQQYQLTVNESGNWQFDLTVQYAHTASVGGLYQDSDDLTMAISSVAANYTAYPTGGGNVLCADEQITLDASSSQFQTGAQLSYQWLVGNQAPNCNTNSYLCILPANFKSPGDYPVQLTLTNQATSPNDVSIYGKTVTFVDCSFNPVISVSDQSPEIGQPIMFTLSGVPGEIDQVNWDFGGAGCDTASTATCTPGILGCDQKTHKYKTSGSKNVTANILYQGSWKLTKPIVVNVQNEGSCGNEPCSYTMSPSNKSFNKDGGTGSFTVSASQSTCSWSPSTSYAWISITSGSGSRGDGTVQYKVAANSGGDRIGTIMVGSTSHKVTQEGIAQGSVDFTISNTNPEIGEKVSFTLAGGTPIRWQMGGVDCDGVESVRECSGMGLCNLTLWEYRDPGTKTITLVCDEGSKSKTITVKETGQCEGECERDSKPTASFEISPNPATIGQQVTFTDTSGGAAEKLLTLEEAKTLGLSLSFSPDDPDIGESVYFQVTGASGSVDEASWNFGEAGCSDYPQTSSCTYDGLGSDCAIKKHKFASGGNKSVSVTVKVSNHSYNIGPVTVPVSNSGSCGGSTTCTYTLNQSSASFPSAQSNGTVSVTAATGCTWTAVSRSGWITVTSGGSGSGSGTVGFRVSANTEASRTGSLQIAGKIFTVIQEAGSGGGGGSDPDQWAWEVSKDGSTLFSRTTQNFTHSFTEPGTYTIRLTVRNCKGSSIETKTLEVVEYVEPEDHVIPSAAHTAGSYNTLWLSDLKLFNPGDKRVSIDLKFMPENQSSPITPGFKINLDPRETKIYDDVLSKVPGLNGENVKGGLLLIYDEGDGKMPTIMSRTFNSTPNGTYGQFIPALPILEKKASKLYLTGLRQNSEYRTNLGLANAADAFASGIKITLLGPGGNVLGTPYEFGIRKRNTIQLANLPSYCNVDGDLDLFSVQIDTNGNSVVAIASVVSMLSGDPWTLSSEGFGDKKVVIPGVAHLPGLLGAAWRTDVTLFNPTDTEITARVDYIPEEELGYEPYFDITLSPKMAYSAEDILYTVLSLGSEEATKGYLIISGYNEAPAPQIAARTYNQTVDSGTYGQGIPGYGESEFLTAGDEGYFAGLCNKASKTANGFRTNVGLVNIADDKQTVIEITLYNLDGSSAGFKRLTLQPGEFRQFNLFTELGFDDSDRDVSAVVKVISGGPAAAYASVLDRDTSDPTFMKIFK